MRLQKEAKEGSNETTKNVALLLNSSSSSSSSSIIYVSTMDEYGKSMLCPSY